MDIIEKDKTNTNIRNSNPLKQGLKHFLILFNLVVFFI